MITGQQVVMLQVSQRLVLGAPIYISGASGVSGQPTASPAQADSAERAHVFGLVSSLVYEPGAPVAIGTSGMMRLEVAQWNAVVSRIGDLDGNGLVVGRTYYLDAWTPGLLTHRKPRLPGQWVVELGTAIAHDTLRIDIKPPVAILPWYPFERLVFNPADIEESPWHRGEWNGAFVAVKHDGTPCVALGDGGIVLLSKGDVRPSPDRIPSDEFPAATWANQRPSDYVDRVLAYGNISERDYGNDGPVAGIAVLKDGRFVSWESMVDSTASGFHGDADLGGKADIFLSATARGAWLAISEQTRELLQFATLPTEEAIVNVIHDRYLELRGIRQTPVSSVESFTGWGPPTGDDGGVPAPLGSNYVQTATAPVRPVLWVMTPTGWQTAEDVTLGWITERRAELVRLATESGEFGDLVEPRVDELLRRWDRHYDEQDALYDEQANARQG